MSKAEFKTWEAQQPIRFELADGRPERLPDDPQVSSRLACVRHLAMRPLADKASAYAWMGAPKVDLGGLEPRTLASDIAEGCQMVLAEPVRVRRHREAAGG